MRNLILLLLRLFAYLFHAGLCTFLIGVAVFTMSTGGSSLKLGMLPWEGTVLVRAILGLGITGLLCVLLAVTGAIRFLFPLWTLTVLVLMFRGYFLTSYSFADESEFHFAIWMTVAALVAFLASLSLFGRRRSAHAS